ncbi:MAG: phosphoribosyl-ATP diphosphatase [Pseudomonadota bacterium]
MSAFDYLDTVVATIASRVGGDPKLSHTAKLLKKGTPRIAKKLGEEAVETAIAAVQGNKPETIAESADMLFHLLVLWQSMGIAPAEVMAELERRKGVSGLAEKAARVEP